MSEEWYRIRQNIAARRDFWKPKLNDLEKAVSDYFSALPPDPVSKRAVFEIKNETTDFYPIGDILVTSPFTEETLSFGLPKDSTNVLILPMPKIIPESAGEIADISLLSDGSIEMIFVVDQKSVRSASLQQVLDEYVKRALPG